MYNNNYSLDCLAIQFIVEGHYACHDKLGFNFFSTPGPAPNMESLVNLTNMLI